jgi:hypothetical protein
VPVAVALEQVQLGRPVDLAGQRARVGLGGGEHRLPALEDLDLDRGEVAVLDRPLDRLEVVPLQLERRGGRAVVEPQRPAAVRSWLTGVEGPDRLGQHRRGAEQLVLDDVEHQQHRADLEEGRDLAQVRVAVDDVQPPVALGSAWGSSRVFISGRLRVVSSPTSTSKKSARCDSWKGTSTSPNSLPTRPAPT